MAADDSGDWCHKKDCLIQEEIEVLESIYIDELQIEQNEKGHPESLCLQLHPATGDDHDKKFVCMTLILQLPEQYPEELPEILIRNPRGLGEEELQSLVESMIELAEDRKGGPMLYEIIELAKESLTEGNVPHCPCMVCLEHFTEGDNFTRTECYHYFHCHCLARYISHTLQVQKEEAEYRDKHHNKEEDKMPCPVCRENIEYDLDSLATAQPLEDQDEKMEISETVRQWQKEMSVRFAIQKQKGGIIDLEAEKNKYLLSAANLSLIPRTGSGSNLESLNKEGQAKGVKDDSATELLQGGRGKNNQSYRDRWKSRLKSAPSTKTDRDNDHHSGNGEEKYHNVNHHRDKYRDEENHRYRYHGNNNHQRGSDYNKYNNRRYRNDLSDRERRHCKEDADKSTQQSDKNEGEAKSEPVEKASNTKLKADIIDNKESEHEGANDSYMQDRRPRYNENYRRGKGKQNFSRQRGGFNNRPSGAGYRVSRDHQNTGSRNQGRDTHSSVSENKSESVSLRNAEKENLHALKADSEYSSKDFVVDDKGGDSFKNVEVDVRGDKKCSTAKDKVQDTCKHDHENSNSSGDVKRESNETKESKSNGRKYNDLIDKDTRNHVDGKQDGFRQNIRRNYKEWDRDRFHGDRRGSGRGSRRSGSDTQKMDRNISQTSNDKSGKHRYSEEKWHRNENQDVRSERDAPIENVKENFKEEVISQDGQKGGESCKKIPDFPSSQNSWHGKEKIYSYTNNEKGNWRGHRSDYSRHKHSEDFGSRKGKGFGRPMSGKQKPNGDNVGHKNSFYSQKQKENDHIDSQGMRKLGFVEDKGTQPDMQTEKCISKSCDNETHGEVKTLSQHKRPPPGFEHVTIASNDQPKLVKPPPGFS